MNIDIYFSYDYYCYLILWSNGEKKYVFVWLIKFRFDNEEYIILKVIKSRGKKSDVY